MNILLFPRIVANTGVGNHVVQLSAELCKQGHKVTVVSAYTVQEFCSEVNFVKLPVDSNSPIQIIKVIKKLHKLIKEQNIDIVHAHHRKAALIMKIYNIFHKMPFVYTLHSSNVPSDFLHRKLTFVGDRAIAISGDVQDFLVKTIKINPKKIAQIANGVEKIEGLTAPEVASKKNEWGIPQDKIVLTMHSRIDPVKNHEVLIDAVASLSEPVKEKVIVVFSGEKSGNYYNSIVQKINDLKINDKFIFVGWQKTANVLGVTDFLFLPSFKEGFSLSVVEAFMLKVPVARTVTGGFYEQKFCLPIDVSDPKPIIEIIENLVENGKEYYADRTESAYNLAMSDFTIETMVRKIVDLYEEVCSGKSTNRKRRTK